MKLNPFDIDIQPDELARLNTPDSFKKSLSSCSIGRVWLEHYRARFVQSMLPEEITLSNGHVLKRPENWK